MKISEYGRNVQKMVDYTVTIEDREKRTRAAYAIVSIMSHLNPGVKDSTDYQRTLWDHMHIISGFKLDVDGPFPAPTQEELFKKPDQIPYSDGNIRYRHYGKNIEGIINRAIEYEEGPEKEALIVKTESGVSEKAAESLVLLGNDIGNISHIDLEEGVSTRSLVYAAKLIKQGIGEKRACSLAIAQAVSDERNEIEAIELIIDKIFG